MRGQKLFFMVMLIMTLVVAGCKSTPKPNNQTTPDWLDEQPPSNVIYGIGFVKLQNSSLAMETATARAQRNVASQLSTLVHTSLVDYAKEAGFYGNSSSMESIERIGRNITNRELSNATVNKRTQLPDGTWWVRVAYSKTDAQRLAREEVTREMANLIDFNRDKALERLDNDINRYKAIPDRR
jgi:hypothetical protein